MFRKYGFLGISLIIFAEIVMLLRIEPFATWYIPFVWSGYILLVDSIVFMLKGNSLLSNRPRKFLHMALLSVNFWFIFEIYNQFIPGWGYVNLPETRLATFTMGSLSFATILPAIFETTELVQQLHIFNKLNLKIKIPTNKFIINILIVLGIVFLVTPFVIISPWMWMFVWTGFILLLDPVLYLFHNEKSLIMLVKKKKLDRIISLFIAGIICGFLWEFWNYWARTKWYYTWYLTLPPIFRIKIFEMPILGYIGFGPFALELYVMYHFIKLLFSKKILGGVAGI
ncbi:MAG: hypothetical protein QMD12_01415 [Candidatus Aenigmarchaeota archaeon]|nr:hypothetical protein [Candidatus Aenigmarchaeota archaeon]